MGAIYLASSQSLPGPAGFIPDWFTHGAAYGTLAVLLCRALAGGFRALPVRNVVLAVVLSTGYGVTDEYHQSFVPERHSELADVAKDLLGALAGGGLFFLTATGASVRKES